MFTWYAGVNVGVNAPNPATQLKQYTLMVDIIIVSY